MGILKELARLIVGALFIFSGAIKINDPVGTAIKMEEYFDVFAHDFAPFFEWFVPMALFIAILLSVMEVVLGVSLLVGFAMRRTSYALLGMIIFFTFLTFYSAFFNKVTDCGCFGDAIKLTPWQSFYKDLVLLGLIVIIFINRYQYRRFFSARASFGIVVTIGALMSFMAFYALRHLPFIDFRAYAVGNHLPTLMQPSEPLKYEYVMIKDGKEYKYDKYPTDTSLEFKSMNLKNPEAQAKITDLAIWNDEGEFTDELLQGDKLLIIIQNASEASTEDIEDIKRLALGVEKADVWALTASGPEAFEQFRHKYQLAIPYFFADATILKTMIRSNPGIILLSDGMVMGKWHHIDTPDASDINRLVY